jgi:hypothetical protein
LLNLHINNYDLPAPNANMHVAISSRSNLVNEVTTFMMTFDRLLLVAPSSMCSNVAIIEQR